MNMMGGNLEGYSEGQIQRLEQQLKDERSETFTHKERAAIRKLFDVISKEQGEEDAISLVIRNGLAEILGVKIKSDSGAYREIRDDPKIHDFLRKIYDPMHGRKDEE